MAKVRPIKKPVDYVSYEPVMLGVGKARAMAWVLEHLHANNHLEDAIKQGPEETQEWLHTVVADALYAALDDVEREYRKLGTDLLAKEFAKAEVERLGQPPEPKDGA